MWQRFTERARRIIFFAQEEAQSAGRKNVDCVAAFAGVLRERESTAARMLVRMGYELDGLLQYARESFGAIDKSEPSDMTLTPEAKRAIDAAARFSEEFQHGYIGSEHLLLGLISVSDAIVDLLGRERGELRTLAIVALVQEHEHSPSEGSSNVHLKGRERLRAEERQRAPTDRLSSTAAKIYAEIGPEGSSLQLLQAILEAPESRGASMVASLDLSLEELAPYFAESPKAIVALVDAHKLSKAEGQTFIGTEHLVAAMLLDHHHAVRLKLIGLETQMIERAWRETQEEK